MADVALHDLKDGQVLSLTPQEVADIAAGRPINPALIVDGGPEVKKRAEQFMRDQAEQWSKTLKPPQKPGTRVPVSSLPPQRQAEVNTALQEMMTAAAAREAEAQVMNPAFVLPSAEPTAAPAPAVEAQPAMVFPSPVNLPPADAPEPTPPEVKPPPTPEPPLTTTVTQCPNCAHNLALDAVEVTDDDKRAYLRAVLGNKPFVLERVLFGGHQKVTFRTRAVAVNNLIQDQLSREAAAGKFPNYDGGVAMNSYFARMRKLQMAASLVDLTGFVSGLPALDSPEAEPRWRKLAQAQPGPDRSADNVTALCHDLLFANWTEPMYAVLFKQFLIFEAQCARLMEAANVPDFWREIVG